MRTKHPSIVHGTLPAAAAFLLWGFLPLYWKLLKTFSASYVLANRIVWSALFLAILVAMRGKAKTALGQLGKRGTWIWIVPSTLVIGFNWFLYIWAVNSGFVLETSLGYFLNPLVNVILGVIFLGERLRKPQLIAVILVVLAVLNLLWHHGGMPWIALGLASSFGFYGLFKKKISGAALVALTTETWLLFLPSFFLVVNQDIPSMPSLLLLAGGGVLTALPLYLFGMAAQHLKLSTIGLLQYIAPTCQFLLAVFVFNESFSTPYFYSFLLIWFALAIYTRDLIKGK